MRLILGSQSPRRKEIMDYFDLKFEQIKPDFDEDAHPFDGKSPAEYALKLARGKAESLAHKYPDALILTADTVVYCKGKSLGKAASEAEAKEMLTMLAGTWHSVFTGLHLHEPDGKALQAFEETRVLFNSLSPEEIAIYLKKARWQDKAGSYAIQGAGSLTIKAIRGCYYNVMGLPVNALNNLLSQVGLPLWDHLKNSSA